MAGFPEWVIGVILIIIGSLGNNLGNNLVSLGHKEVKEKSNNEKLCSKHASSKKLNGESAAESSAVSTEFDYPPSEKQNNEEEKATCMSWRVMGTIIFVLGNLFTFGSFGFGAQSLLASLESIQFVSNLFFAKYVHNEAVTTRMSLATLSIVSGNVLVVIFAEHHVILHHSTGMIHLYKTNNAYHAYLVLAFCLWGLTNYIYMKYHHSRVKLSKLLWKHTFMEPFCYAMSSAIIGTQAVLNSKCMSMLIQVTLRGEKNEFESWYIYFILITWVILVAYWLQRLDNGLALFPPLFIIPVMQVFFVFFAIVCGGIYFNEFHAFDASQWIGFVFGVSMILGGVYGLAPTDMVLQTPDNVVVPEVTSAEGTSDDEGNVEGDVEMGLMSPTTHQTERSQVNKNEKVGSQHLQAESELDQLLAPQDKDKPGNKSPRGSLIITTSVTAEPTPHAGDSGEGGNISKGSHAMNLYTQSKTSPSDGFDSNNSPTNQDLLLSPLTPNGFTTVRLEPLGNTQIATNSKKNRKIVKRGGSNLQSVSPTNDESTGEVNVNVTALNELGVIY